MKPSLGAAISHRDGVSSAMGFAVQEILEVSSLWFGLGAQPKVFHTLDLEATVINEALMCGQSVRWGNWTIRSTPPRYVLTGDGEEYWIPSIWVSSQHGFSTFVWSSTACVESVCRYIQKKEAKAVELAMVCESDDEAD